MTLTDRWPQSAAAQPRSEATGFRGLVLLLRVRTGLLQRELAAAVGVTERTIQTWESGANYPTAERLKRLIEVGLQRGAFAAGREEEQAGQLWKAAVLEAPRLAVPFDRDWFGALLGRTPGAPSAPANVTATEPRRRHDWDAAPDVGAFHGRTQELAALVDWLLSARCRVVALLGLAGIGKTALAARLGAEVATQFRYVFWRSLHDAPPVDEWLSGAIGFLSAGQSGPPEGREARLSRLLELLRQQRCLLVLDGFEAVLQPGEHRGRYRDGDGGFGLVVQRLAESGHQSCLLLTSREKPPEVSLLEGERAPVRSLRLGGLGAAEGRLVLEDKGLVGVAAAWQALIARYGGNPLALKAAGEAIGQVTGGDIAAFLADSVASFGSIRRLLDGQVDRLSELERSLLSWLAVEREPVGLAELVTDLGPAVERAETLEALESLGRRSFLERGERRATIALQPVVLEYVTERLISRVGAEVVEGRPVLFRSHALVKATAGDHVRRSQERRVATPLLERLVTACGTAEEVERRLLDLLRAWQGQPPAGQAYGPGNAVNLLRLLRGDLRGVDLSRLFIRQAYLRGVEAQDASLVDAQLAESVLAEPFDGGAREGTVGGWDARSGTPLSARRPDRPYERMDITGLTGVTAEQKAALTALGARERT
jgi:transcriptional regulator with XRE-family HTH domain